MTEHIEKFIDNWKYRKVIENLIKIFFFLILKLTTVMQPIPPKSNNQVLTHNFNHEENLDFLLKYRAKPT